MIPFALQGACGGAKRHKNTVDDSVPDRFIYDQKQIDAEKYRQKPGQAAILLASGRSNDLVRLCYNALKEGNWSLVSGSDAAICHSYSQYGNMTYLHYAAAFADEHMTRKALADGLNPCAVDPNDYNLKNSSSDKGVTPLMYAAQHGNSAMVKVLLEDGRVSPNTVCYWGWNALMYAVKNFAPDQKRLEGIPHYLRDYAGVMQLLIPKTDLGHMSTNQETVVSMARRKQNDYAVNLLKEAGAEL